ncbi:MAG TPA: CPBP family intramembrane metalloprotease [Bacteroidia bacterium]|nr:CPBP family intramembrane metalloprotease [Bacteroidia bacterium]HNT79086.1 CPBP family intramembrane metalloprotease [Bacteroidia bacterium]
MNLLPDWKIAPYSSKLFVLLGIILISSIVITLFSFLLITIILGVSFDEVNMVLNSSNHIHHLFALKLFQSFSSIGMFLIPALLIPKLFKISITDFFPLQSLNKIQIAYAILISIMLIPVINILVYWNAHISMPEFLIGIEQWMKEKETAAAIITERLLVMNGISDLLINIFIIALLPALGEEFLFRGVVLKMLKEWFGNIHTAIWCTAIIFSALHLQFYGFVPRMLLGALLGYVFYWSGTIWLPVLLHFLNNAISVLAEYLMQHNIVQHDLNTLGADDTIYITVISLPILTWMILKLKKGRIEAVPLKVE